MSPFLCGDLTSDISNWLSLGGQLGGLVSVVYFFLQAQAKTQEAHGKLVDRVEKIADSMTASLDSVKDDFIAESARNRDHNQKIVETLFSLQTQTTAVISEFSTKTADTMSQLSAKVQELGLARQTVRGALDKQRTTVSGTASSNGDHSTPPQQSPITTQN